MDNIYSKKPLGRKNDGSSYTAVVVDDSTLSRAALKQILLSLEFNVIYEVDNGGAAVVKLEVPENRPDYLFIDLEMPVMNGIEVLQKVRPILENTKIFMVTSVSDREKVDELIKLGINGYVKKPYDRDTVVRQLHKQAQN
ncbi:MAG TPA: response regulator [Spirochaetota bacterium]|nr:response regulator [Spirochaetota bacterium]HQO40710.1 response regulator [Spirochaetota bacterium]